MQALAFAELLGGGVLLTAAITGHSPREVMAGEIPSWKKLEEKKASSSEPETGGMKNAAFETGVTTNAKAISPFPAGVPIQWGRSDQGVDGVVPPNTPLRAMGKGVVSIAKDPSGFGASYPVLHIDNDGAYYYGHSVPLVTGRVQVGQVIARANTNGQGNAKTPGSFEIGTWPPGSMSLGATIRKWFTGLPRL